MRVALTVPSVSSINCNHDGHNVQGDEIIARAWLKEMMRRQKPGDTYALFSGLSGKVDGFDIVIHFSIFYPPWPGVKNILYMQNAFPPEAWPGGTVGQFKNVADRYDAFLFTSEVLRVNCGITDRPTAVVPFAVDTDDYHPFAPVAKYAHPVVFVGNNIRGNLVNRCYLEPAIPYGLVIYGNRDGWGNPFNAVCRGKIPKYPDEPQLYSSANICLNCHINEHIVHDTINFRIFAILACGGFVISDRTPTLVRDFASAVEFTDGGPDLSNKLAHYLACPNDTVSFRQAGKELVLSAHTFAHRITTVFDFLGSL